MTYTETTGEILLTGGSGQLGQELQSLQGFLAPGHSEFDITDEVSVERYLRIVKPDLILHAAAYTKTLVPENDPQEAVSCYNTNVLGTRNIAKYAQCPVFYISSESVVDPYNFYAITKLQGEHEIQRYAKEYMILRTSFRFNPFEYDKACTDMYTIGDYVNVIAKLIVKSLVMLPQNKIIYVGTGIKTTYELAKQTRPDVTPILTTDLPHTVPSFSELLNVSV